MVCQAFPEMVGHGVDGDGFMIWVGDVIQLIKYNRFAAGVEMSFGIHIWVKGADEVTVFFINSCAEPTL